MKKMISTSYVIPVQIDFWYIPTIDKGVFEFISYLVLNHLYLMMETSSCKNIWRNKLELKKIRKFQRKNKKTVRMKAWERKFLELENSLNSYRESNAERLVGLESVGRENSRKISELESKINPVSENVPPENQLVNFTFWIVL